MTDREAEAHRGHPVSRVGTAKALVLLAGALLFAAGAVTCFLVLVFGPPLLDLAGITGQLVLAVVVFVLVLLTGVVLAAVAAVRGRSTRAVVAGGCGSLLAGAVLGLAVLLLLVAYLP